METRHGSGCGGTAGQDVVEDVAQQPFGFPTAGWRDRIGHLGAMEVQVLA
ncbi:hypothetical protein GTA28_27075 [Rhodococcus hoagii]|nr:hypothetical protein [Prescottella equi]